MDQQKVFINLYILLGELKTNSKSPKTPSPQRPTKAKTYHQSQHPQQMQGFAPQKDNNKKSPEMYLAPVVLHRRYHNGCTWLYRAVPGCTWLYLAVRGCTALYLAVPHSTYKWDWDGIGMQGPLNASLHRGANNLYTCYFWHFSTFQSSKTNSKKCVFLCWGLKLRRRLCHRNRSPSLVNKNCWLQSLAFNSLIPRVLSPWL